MIITTVSGALLNAGEIDMDAIGKLLNKAARTGVYHLNRDAGQLAKSAAEAGLSVWRVDIGDARDKADFLGKIAAAMRFPDTFGGNWDAFADCLRDLSWVEGSGYVLIFENSQNFCITHRDEFDVAMDIFDDAAAYWRDEGKPFWVMVGGPQGWYSGCEPLPET
jgi:RNAse (barnase) inhibitor barstar